MSDLLIAVIMMVIAYIFHELGHYLVAWKNDMKPRFFFAHSSITKFGFGVKYTRHLENPDNKTVIKEIDAMIKFAAGGSLGIIPILVYGFISGEYTVSFAVCLMMSLYSLQETITAISDADLQFTDDKSPLMVKEEVK